MPKEIFSTQVVHGDPTNKVGLPLEPPRHFLTASCFCFVVYSSKLQLRYGYGMLCWVVLNYAVTAKKV